MSDASVLPVITLTEVGVVGGGGVMSLIFITTPPGIFRKDGDCLLVEAAAVLAANPNAKSTNLLFDGNAIGGRSASDNNSVHFIQSRIIRKSLSGDLMTCWFVGITSNLITATVVVTQGTFVTFQSASSQIVLAGEGVSNNDVVSKMLRCQYVPSGSNYDF